MQRIEIEFAVLFVPVHSTLRPYGVRVSALEQSPAMRPLNFNWKLHKIWPNDTKHSSTHCNPKWTVISLLFSIHPECVRCGLHKTNLITLYEYKWWWIICHWFRWFSCELNSETNSLFMCVPDCLIMCAIIQSFSFFVWCDVVWRRACTARMSNVCACVFHTQNMRCLVPPGENWFHYNTNGRVCTVYSVTANVCTSCGMSGGAYPKCVIHIMRNILIFTIRKA